jgi:hypothetical protein
LTSVFITVTVSVSGAVVGGIVLTIAIILGVKRRRQRRVLDLPGIELQIPECSSSEDTVFERPNTRPRALAIKEI